MEGLFLRIERELNNLSQIEMSNKLNIENHQLCGMELGMRNIYLEDLISICDVLNIDFFMFYEYISLIKTENKKIETIYNEKYFHQSFFQSIILNEAKGKIKTATAELKQKIKMAIDYESLEFIIFKLVYLKNPINFKNTLEFKI